MNTSLRNKIRSIALLCVLITLSGCDRKTAQTPSPTAVYVTSFDSSDATEERWLSATVRARVETDLGFRTGGKIVQRLVNIGDRVASGQPLARLDDADYRLALSAAADQLKAAGVDARQSASDAERFQRLVSDGSMGSADLERQKSRYDAASAREEQARRALQVAQNKNSYTTLTAPYSGVITAINMEVGQVVAEGAPVVSIAKENEREVVADLPEEMVNHVREFKAKALSWENNATSVALYLRELSPLAASQSRTYRARYAPKSSSDIARFPLGSTLQLQLYRRSAPGITLPLNALVKTTSAPGVWALNSAEDGVVFKKVNVLSYGAETVRVTGLQGNIRIVTAGAQKLDPLMKVRPIERTLEISGERGSL